MDAILWDYDGTLVNSVPKNIAITKEILAIVAPHLTGSNLPVYLRDQDQYHHANHAAKNWQELYLEYYGLTNEEMNRAGALWAKHQASNTTPVSLFPGIDKLIHAFASLPHGICSQNAKANIRNVLSDHGVNSYFKSVVGYEDVESGYQKPHPLGGQLCVEEILGRTSAPKLMYVGDHEADIQFARNLQNVLGNEASVVAVAVGYSGATPEAWETQPDFIAHDVPSLIDIIKQRAVL